MATVCLALGWAQAGRVRAEHLRKQQRMGPMSILVSSRGDKTMNRNKIDRAIKAERGEASTRSGVARKGW